ncbi:hypothetical protein C8R32_10160 [Nitrosospira sp. Nsp5]|uniref:Uncharacterized protein n=1 Tax=Nitrosospira multiformis TaxID=1231 RepID=A0ABY0THL6_9PROT|nr:hypothetical protein C8R32_10160 [Nitrosospira sp. Nsp5]SDQ81528.1 hypothetical protein SAMN05216402_2402 [Nitrosospira multiformis]
MIDICLNEAVTTAGIRDDRQCVDAWIKGRGQPTVSQRWKLYCHTRYFPLPDERISSMLLPTMQSGDKFYYSTAASRQSCNRSSNPSPNLPFSRSLHRYCVTSSLLAHRIPTVSIDTYPCFRVQSIQAAVRGLPVPPRWRAVLSAVNLVNWRRSQARRAPPVP